MKISLRWLNDLVQVDDYYSKPEELGKILTAAGLELEAVENPGESLKSVVVGQIKVLGQHPNADRLTLCQVDVGDGTLRQIVCGAKNHKQGDKVAVALPGAVLPGNFAIKLSKIRDVESQGMLCSFSELGFAKESEGILILPAEAPVGVPFADYYCDILLEINVTPNRADCLSHLGLARELSATLNRPLKPQKVEFKTDSMSTQKAVKLSVKDIKNCPRYSGRLLQNIKVGPSPEAIRKRLEAVGMNSINNVVDITNYVMMELGQPMHAFDLDHLKGASVIIDKSVKGEKFISLDGTEYTLSGDELTIRDQDRAVCLAGVVGGKNSGVSDSTKNIFLESAHFAMDSVRRTSRRLGLQTDSAYRFSRGTDATQTVKALDLACSLLQKYAGATVAGDFYDEYPSPIKRQPIAVDTKYVEDRIGFPVTEADFGEWMKRIGCKVDEPKLLKLVPPSEKQYFNFLVTPPDFRSDIEMKEDLIEEFGRLQGYDKIPEVLPPFGGAPLKHADEYTFDGNLVRILEEEGFQQSINYGFIANKFQEEFMGARDGWAGTGLPTPAQAVGVRNPLNEDLNVMRLSLAPWLYKNFVHNARHGLTEGRLFENGFVFDKLVSTKGDEGYVQNQRLALLGWGKASGLWQKEKHLPYFDLKTGIENLCQRLRVGNPKGNLRAVSFQSLEFRPSEKLPSFLHPAQSAVIFCEGKNIGYIGAIHPKLLNDEKISYEAAIAEIDVSALRRGQPRPVKYQPISKLPSAERDFAFLVPVKVTASQISAEIRKASGAVLQSLEVFDVFEGGNLPEGFRSIAYRLVLQDPNETLGEAQLAKLQTDILSALEKKLSVKIR
jgi:phenylalanyl-tRNA synthetase beta chain